MTEPNETHDGAGASQQQPSGTSSPPVRDVSARPGFDEVTVGSGSVRGGKAALAAWVLVPFVLVLLVLLGFFMLPGMGANRENDEERQGNRPVDTQQER
jgi:hypothetical protein